MTHTDTPLEPSSSSHAPGHTREAEWSRRFAALTLAWLSFETLYRLSTLYPVAVLLLARAITRTRPAPATVAPP